MESATYNIIFYYKTRWTREARSQARAFFVLLSSCHCFTEYHMVVICDSACEKRQCHVLIKSYTRLTNFIILYDDDDDFMFDVKIAHS